MHPFFKKTPPSKPEELPIADLDLHEFITKSEMKKKEGFRKSYTFMHNKEYFPENTNN